MKVGAPFNPYKVFQGAFAPYWILEHRGISAGAKLCYIRLLGFAGKDARCYPSLETLGAGLGVSDRQARDYVKELEHAGLITVDQRGLRKTNVYSFLCTAELAQLLGSVPDRPTDPSEGEPGPEGGRDPDRNTASALDRNSCSGLDRKYPAALERNSCSGPIGINSEGNTSLESSSSSVCSSSSATQMTERPREPEDERKNCAAQAIRAWLASKGIKRLRSDRRVGLPEKERLDEWAGIILEQGIDELSNAELILERAVVAASRASQWRSWNFLTLQIQIAAEQWRPLRTAEARTVDRLSEVRREEAPSDWKLIKSRIRERIPEIAFLNWFDATRQVERCGAALVVAVPDDVTAAYIAAEYDGIVQVTAAAEGITQVRFVPQDVAELATPPIYMENSTVEATASALRRQN
jgi:hypothetical protein